jgi:transcriptional regulator with XRE-family HTH domain
MVPNPEQLASELIRALRGARSQPAFSRRIKCRSNVLYTWEAGRRYPSATRFFEVAGLAGVDVETAIVRFLRIHPEWLNARSLSTRDGLIALLAELKGQRSVADIARATARSRFRVARWLDGETEPRLPDLLRLIGATTYRLYDFCAAFAPPSQLPSISARWEQLEAARQVAYSAPWCQVVLRLLETQSLAGELVQTREIAARLGLAEVDVDSYLRLLQTSGQLQATESGWKVLQTANVDMAEDRDAVQRLKTWAAEIGVERIRRRAEGIYSYNLFCVSEADYRRIQQLQREYFRQLRAIVAESHPSERVVMTNLQLFSLDG